VLENRLRLAASAFTYLDEARAKTAGLVVSANTALRLIPNLYALFGGELLGQIRAKLPNACIICLGSH
jgi:hypothetical protein